MVKISDNIKASIGYGLIVTGIVLLIFSLVIIIGMFFTQVECSFNGELQGNVEYNGTSITNFEIQKIRLENTYCKIPIFFLLASEGKI